MNTITKPLAKPLLRGHFHQAAFFFTLGACAMLLARAHDEKNFIAALIYSLSLTGLFGISALYHRLNWNPKKRMWMRRLDHAAIYILIAGTSTPICLLALSPNVGIKVLTLVWGAASFGIFQSLFWITAPKWVSSTLYVIVGCLVVPYLQEFRAALDLRDIVFIFLGGAFYIVGAVVYATKRPDPSPAVFGYHEIFHLLVIFGALFHFLAVSPLIR